jgi:hypothetical protein
MKMHLKTKGTLNDEFRIWGEYSPGTHLVGRGTKAVRQHLFYDGERLPGKQIMFHKPPAAGNGPF